eukprot:scaffold50515_cov56-Phaeocystis_antarctica.AAC.3
MTRCPFLCGSYCIAAVVAAACAAAVAAVAAAAPAAPAAAAAACSRHRRHYYRRPGHCAPRAGSRKQARRRAAGVKVVEGRVLGELDGVRRALEDGVVRGRVVVDVHHAVLLDDRPHRGGEGRLVLRRVDRVEVEAGRAEEELRAPADAGVGAAQRVLHEREGVAPRRGAVEVAKLRAEDERRRAVAHRVRAPRSEGLINEVGGRAVEEVEHTRAGVAGRDPCLGLGEHAWPARRPSGGAVHGGSAAGPRRVHGLLARAVALAAAAVRPAVIVEGRHLDAAQGVAEQLAAAGQHRSEVARAVDEGRGATCERRAHVLGLARPDRRLALRMAGTLGDGIGARARLVLAKAVEGLALTVVGGEVEPHVGLRDRPLAPRVGGVAAKGLLDVHADVGKPLGRA